VLRDYINGMSKISTNLKTALLASLEAGAAIMNIYGSAFDISSKADASPLTKADLDANTVINKHLLPLNIPIISEENKLTNFSERKKWDTCWIVDPLDGTKEFVNRNGEFTVNIALIIDKKPALGVIYVPVSKTLYYADISQKKAFKAELNSHKSSLEEIKKNSVEISPKKGKTSPIEVVASRSHLNDATTAFISALNDNGETVKIVSKGSSLKFCLIAEGKADIYPRFAPTMEWDTAAGQAICNAVDVQVISKEDEKSLLYNKENLLNPWFLVSKS